MANYNIREVLKYTRTAKDIDQVSLSGEICTQTTLSGYETAKHKVRSATYKKLMAELGRMPERQYTVCVDKDGGMLEDRLAFERAFKRYDYEAAEKYLLRMKERADDNVLTQQYIARAEILVEHRLKRITAEEKLSRVDKALRMTVPEYDTFLQKGKVFPFVKEELMALMNLGDAYRGVENYNEALKIDEWILQCIESGYLGRPESITIPLNIRENISKIYEDQRRHVEALEIVNMCIQKVRETNYGHRLAPLMTSKAYNYIQLVKNGYWNEEKREEARKILRQAYYVAAARGDRIVMSRINVYYKQHFGEGILV